MIYQLLIVEFILILIMYILSNRCFISPAFIAIALFFLATCCVVYNIEFWNVQYSKKTLWFITTGFLAMCIPEYKIEYVQIYPSRQLNLIFALLSVVFFGVLLVEILRKGDYSTLGLYAIGAAKSDETQNSVIARFGISLITGLNLAYLYVFINNVIRCKERVLSNIKYLFPTLMYILCMFISGNRVFLVKLFAIVFLIYIVMKSDVSPRGRVPVMQVVRKTLFVAVAILAVFYALRGITKVNSTAATREFSDYITYYIGSPVYMLDKYLQRYSPELNWGAKSLTSLVEMFGIEPEFKNAYIHVGGDSNFAGNEFSWFQRPYSDFGWLGMLVFTFIVFWIFSWNIHIRINKEKNRRRRKYYILIMAYFFYIPVMSFYYCQMCFAFSITNIFSVVVACLLVREFTKRQDEIILKIKEE